MKQFLSVLALISPGALACDGLPQYQAGTAYSANQEVKNLVQASGAVTRFKCLIPGWCSSGGAWAYEPGNGLYWQDAWEQTGLCDATNPTARANGPYSAEPGANVQFSSAGSSDPQGDNLRFLWRFGDGNSSEEANPIHVYAASGNYLAELSVTDVDGNTDTDTANVRIAGPGGGDPLPVRTLVGYWHNFVNGAGYLPLSQVSQDWDIINISFAENAPGGAEGEVAFVPAEEPEAEFLAAVRLHQQRGKKVLISLGGANAHIQLNSANARDNFVRTMGEIIARYGFDGLDIDLEGGSLNMTSGDTVAEPKTPAIVNLIAAVKSLKARFGEGFVLTMAPETAYVQGGYQVFGGIWGAYLPLIHALRQDLNLLHVQHYNTGSILAPDGQIYAPASSDFHVALTDMMITGFNAGGNASNRFPGLAPEQLAFGLPASTGAASSGYTQASEVHKALDCLYLLQQCGAYTPQSRRSGMRGVMTWSINWDAATGFAFSSAHRGYLDR